MKKEILIGCMWNNFPRKEGAGCSHRQHEKCECGCHILFGLKTKFTGIVLDSRFKTEKEAKEWGDWNDKGNNSYDVVLISPNN